MDKRRLEFVGKYLEESDSKFNLRYEMHKALDERLTKLLSEHDPAEEGIIDLVVVLTTVDSEEKGVNFAYQVELCALGDGESWEVEETNEEAVEVDLTQ